MDLQQLADEYTASAEKLLRGLERVRKLRFTARGEQALELERREEVMRQELTDLRSISRHLREYYA